MRLRVANRASRDSTNIIIILGMMQVSKKIPFEDPDVLNMVRALYVTSNLLIAGIYIYVQLQINKKKGMLFSPLNLWAGMSLVARIANTNNHDYRSDYPQVC